MTIVTRIQNNKVQIITPALFDASVYPKFRHTCAMLLVNGKIEHIQVDLSGTNYLDSAALGMLVQLNENARYAKKQVTLISVPGRVAEVLKIANAHKLFAIHLPSGIALDMD